jgi:lysine-specific demethylase/histidyl-hydroxylase NO66
VQANAYATPAASQGFGVHHDTHDVLVLQVAGAKRWRIYAPLLELPLKQQRWSADLGDPGEPVEDLTLEAGDTLYLPRGWPHEATAADADSLHVTVGLHPATRLDALRQALEACADDVEFRRALDPGGELPAELLERLAARLRPADVAQRARRRFVDARRPILPDQLAQLRALERLTLATPLERRPTVIADLETPADAAGIALRFEGKLVRFPPQAAAAVAFAHGAGEPFSAAELPGALDAAGRLVLVRRLVGEGFLRLP